MKLFLVSALGEPNIVQRWTDFARRDTRKIHCLANSPEDADVILFLDPHLLSHRHDWQLKGIRDHELNRQFPHKVFVYDERDLPWQAFPGVYVSMPRSAFDSRSQRAFCYQTLMNEYVAPGEEAAPDLLFSFVGSPTHRVREELWRLKHPRALCEKNPVNMFVMEGGAPVRDRKQVFASVLQRSKFVLCPRGYGTSSIRLFECLSAGRVPVIISDDWVAPLGPDWQTCSLRVAQSQVASIPALLENAEEKWPAMSQAARQTYADWFAPDVLFHRYAECFAELLPTASHAPQKTSRQFFVCAFHNALVQARVQGGAWKAKLRRR